LVEPVKRSARERNGYVKAAATKATAPLGETAGAIEDRAHAGYCLFETALGLCGIAWRETGNSGPPLAVTFFQLPEATAQIAESRMARKSDALRSDAPPAGISQIIERVHKHLLGDVQDFRDVILDLRGAGAFARLVYDAARKIPAGETTTYGAIATGLGEPGAARAVGGALGANPVPLIVPCHRVLAAGGKSGGFSAHGGRDTKARLLEIEGVRLPASLAERMLF
jgi:O-6-methylguanine DNA methyltransferase